MEIKSEYKPASRLGLSFRSVLIVLLLNVLVSSVSVYVYDRFFSLKVVAFDVRGYMAGQKKLFYEGKITEEELLGGLDRLDAILKQENKNTLILNGDAVIKNAKFIQP